MWDTMRNLTDSDARDDQGFKKLSDSGKQSRAYFDGWDDVRETDGE